MDLKEIQQKLNDKLKPSGWSDKLRMLFLGPELNQILTTLYNSSQKGEHFTPTLKHAFRAFEECPYDKLKVVIITQGPYVKLDVADGIAFSCNHGNVEPMLSVMLEEINRTVYQEEKEQDPDLKRWANQGVLLLNTSLTTELNQVESHKELWKPFTANVLEMLATYNSGLVYVFLGTAAKEWEAMIPAETNYKCFVPHPLTGVYDKYKIWDSVNVFNYINSVLEKNNGEKIIW